MKLMQNFIFILIITAIALNGCKKTTQASETIREEIVTARPVPQSPPVQSNCVYEFDEAAILNAGWTRTFDENFNSNEYSQWNIWYGGAFNNELQLYQASNLTITGGNLEITPRKETVTGPTHPWDAAVKTFNYTSGRVESKATFSSSAATPKVRMMARIKLPAGYGMWPAFWSYGPEWPKNGEIDMLEARGQEDYKYQTNYFYGKVANRNLVRGAEGYITTVASLQHCYHVYEVTWSQSDLKFYFDGILVKTNSGGYVPSLFGKTQWITLNVAVGGNFFSNLNPALIQTGTMYVDWVKVFTSN